MTLLAKCSWATLTVPRSHRCPSSARNGNTISRSTVVSERSDTSRSRTACAAGSSKASRACRRAPDSSLVVAGIDGVDGSGSVRTPLSSLSTARAASAADSPRARWACIRRTRRASASEYNRNPPAERTGRSRPYRLSHARRTWSLTPRRRLSSPMRSTGEPSGGFKGTGPVHRSAAQARPGSPRPARAGWPVSSTQQALTSDEQLAEAFAYLSLTVFTAHFLNYAATELHLPPAVPGAGFSAPI